MSTDHQVRRSNKRSAQSTKASRDVLKRRAAPRDQPKRERERETPSRDQHERKTGQPASQQEEDRREGCSTRDRGDAPQPRTETDSEEVRGLQWRRVAHRRGAQAASHTSRQTRLSTPTGAIQQHTARTQRVRPHETTPRPEHLLRDLLVLLSFPHVCCLH